jgi:hypothetical protein
MNLALNASASNVNFQKLATINTVSYFPSEATQLVLQKPQLTGGQTFSTNSRHQERN